MTSDPRSRKPIPDENDLELETDSRFPSGPWVGYFLQAELPPGKHGMELRLTFKRGVITGEGRDMIGDFIIRGKYQVEDGKCWWTKRFIGKHDVAYQGYNEGKGIWGTWEIPPSWKGGFYIWPEAMGTLSMVLTTFFSGLMLPLAIFPGWFGDLARALPWAAMAQVPADVYLGTAEPGRALAFQAVWAAVLIALGALMTGAARRKVVIQGG